MTTANKIMVLVHPGSACGSADFNIGISAGAMREALAAEIQAWEHDILIVRNSLCDELKHYAVLGIVLDNAAEKPGRRVVEEHACDQTGPHWPEIVKTRFQAEWPAGPHEVLLTGAWYDEMSENGCINAVAEMLSNHLVTVSHNALRV